MRKLIDAECDLPPDESGKPRKFTTENSRVGFGDPELMEPLPGYGFSNYERIFTNRAPPKDPAAIAAAAAKPKGMSIEAFLAEMDAAGVEMGVLTRVPNQLLAELLAKYPKRFLGLASISPFDGMRGVREFERLVREHNLTGLRVGALFNGVAASDRRYYPLYAKCVELDVPVRIYTAMNYANDRPYDLGHPRHLDQIAIDFPELTIIAGLAGWPWVNEMVAILRRHPKLFIDTAAHHPRYFTQPGSGWEMFMQYGNSLLQDKVMIGLSRGTFGLPMKDIAAEYAKLPLKDAVLEKWFYGNAKRIYRID